MPIEPDNPELYDVTARDLDLYALVGDQVVEVLQHDKAEFMEDGVTFIELCFASGRRVRAYGDGAFCYYAAGEPTGVEIGTRDRLLGDDDAAEA